MLQGERVRLRTLRSGDLDRLLENWSDMAARGRYFPQTVFTEAELRRRMQENGFWSEHAGWLLIEDAAKEFVGLVFFFQPNPFYPYYEIGYIVFSGQHRGKGYMTEAVSLLCGWLFDNRRINKLLLSIMPDNQASRRVAEKCGFTLEGVDRQGAYVGGRFQDMQRYSLVRAEWDARREAPALTLLA